MDTNITKKPDCLVVLSGGQDSTTCLLWAKEHFNKVHAITFDYGQRHALELLASRQVAAICGIEHHTFARIGDGTLLSTSPLVDRNASLELYTDFKSMDAIIGDRVEKTFVPMRNALFLTIAANHAIAAGAPHIVTGVCQADNANYPDCREDFIMAQERAINEALGVQHCVIHTPLMHMSKASSIAMLFTMGFKALATLAFSHTAYDGMYPPVGKDHASVLRAQGFLEANMPDPLVVRAWLEGAMDLPDTPNYKGDRAGQLVLQLQAEIAEMQKLFTAPEGYFGGARFGGTAQG